MPDPIRLTQFSPGAGCGCKIAPGQLETILRSEMPAIRDSRLLVGYESRDDAAAYDLGDGTAILSTTDFFMPVTDDACDFGRIASANALSDIYAMGGKPLMAISILGWPLEKLPPELASQVLEGSREICRQAGIPLAGGHSIDSLEPIFGLAVTGRVEIKNLRRNSTAKEGDLLFITKPLGVGILTTAEKKGLLRPGHLHIARDSMIRLNKAGAELGRLDGVHAMTDVTGFGLLGHLLEICEGSIVSARLSSGGIPVFKEVYEYLVMKAIPGGTRRNWNSYGHKISGLSAGQRDILCDPQTSGGLLVSASPDVRALLEELAAGSGCTFSLIGEIISREEGSPVIFVS